MRAHAKLTLSLRVTGVRSDGFHELDALVAFGGPSDLLSATLAAGRDDVMLTVHGAADGLLPVPADGRNLVVRAVTGLRAALDSREPAMPGPQLGLDLELHKSIPAGGGLGGGSVDAAAALLIARRLLDAEQLISDRELAAIGAMIGSDVPVCLAGAAFARMQGRGEVVETISRQAPGLAVAVFTPAFACSTPAVYRAWDRLGRPVGRELAVPAPLRTSVPWLPSLRNDLEPAAESIEPRLHAYRTAVEDVMGAPALLAGSGSSLIVIVDLHDTGAKRRAEIATARAGPGTVVTSPLVDRPVHDLEPPRRRV